MSTSNVLRFEDYRDRRAQRLLIAESLCGASETRLALLSHVAAAAAVTGADRAAIVWAKLLHAGRWLGDPGRTGESVSWQLEYSSGAGFRRALRNYTGATPMEIREAGGLEPVLDAFLATCGLGRHQPRGLFVV